MTSRQILNATYAYLVGWLGRDKVDDLLDGGKAQREETPEQRARREAAENQAGLAALGRLESLPRAGGSR